MEKNIRIDQQKNILYQFEELDVQKIFAILLRDRKIILSLVVVISALSLLYAVLLTPLYKSSTTLYPFSTSGEYSIGTSQFKGVAAMLGIETGDIENTLNIIDIVKSEKIGLEVIDKKWDIDGYKQPLSLATYWGIDDTTSFTFNPISLLKKLIAGNSEPGQPGYFWKIKALQTLNDRVLVGKSKESNLITISVLMEDPKLASDIANYMSELIVEYIIDLEKAYAHRNREFIEERQKSVSSNLDEAEDRLIQFREQNRNLSNSPLLQLQLERYMRKVEVQKAIYINLQQQYEIARINEVKEMPSIVVLDSGRPAIKKDRPSRKTIVIVGFILSFCFGCIVVLLKEKYFKKQAK